MLCQLSMYQYSRQYTVSHVIVLPTGIIGANVDMGAHCPCNPRFQGVKSSYILFVICIVYCRYQYRRQSILG